jgi:hypothetical protein
MLALNQSFGGFVYPHAIMKLLNEKGQKRW